MTKRLVDPEEMTITDAVENLSSMAEVDAEVLGVDPDSQWVDPKKRDQAIGVMKKTFKTVHKYLEDVYTKDREVKDETTQKGVQAIMSLAGEAAEKIDQYTSVFKHAVEAGSVTELKEYQDLQNFYLNKLAKRFHEALETEEAWQEEWGNGEIDRLDVQRTGLKGLETVKRDRDYELFYILKEDGKPFFNKNLLRHIKLVNNFDEVAKELEGEDPLLKIKIIQDRDAHETALEIRKNLEPYLKPFYQHALKFKDNDLVMVLNKAIMALFMTSNQRNLMLHKLGKSCINYYEDFQKYMREALSSGDYYQLIDSSIEDLDLLSLAMLHLIHALSYYFYTRAGIRKELVDFVQRLVKQQKGKLNQSKNIFSFWNQILDDHETITLILRRYPNGPLLKILDIFQEMEHEAFDPTHQDNCPSTLFAFSHQAYQGFCLRVPSPTKQTHIHKAEVIEEFRSFLRHSKSERRNAKYLLINLQDRTSWLEHARSNALEKLQKEAEFSTSLVVVTIPKTTDFYLQTEDYLKLEEANAFMKILQEQIESREECGFFFPPSISKEEISAFVKNSVPMIHEIFFGKKKKLTRKNRLDFIEIFYLLLLLKILELVHPTYFSFSCKDAIDVGEAQSSAFFALIKILNGSDWSDSERDFFLWMIFGPPLIIRDRLMDFQRLSRTISAISVLHAEFNLHRDKILKKLETLYEFPIFKKMDVQES